MEPIEAYKDTAQRAQRYLKLHDGLINTRQRAIRADWKRSFCSLMHWPQGSQIERVDSRDAILILRNNATLVPDDFSKQSLEDLLRAALTFGVSALDRYVHERVIKSFVSAYRKSALTKQQKELGIPVTIAMDIIKKVHAANKNGSSVRPANEIRKAIQELLHKRPFQSWREIEYAFQLIGIKNLSGQLQNEFNVGDMKPIKAQLNKIVERRNHIVHEGDLVRHQRGGQVKTRAIERKYVSDSLSFIEDLVMKLENVSA